MRTRIISAFPGTGKSYFYDHNKETTLDSDSSLFSWVVVEYRKIRNPEFPQNYIERIKNNIGKYEFILVSSHAEVREALKDNCIFFYLIYPDIQAKDAYIQRFTDRGSPQEFINLISSNWDKWITQCQMETVGCKNICMTSPYLEDELNRIKSSENIDLQEKRPSTN